MSTVSEAEILRLFDAKVASAWDWSSGRRGDLEDVRQTVLDVAAGRLDESALSAVAERVAYNPHAVQTLTEQCRTVIREAAGQ